MAVKFSAFTTRTGTLDASTKIVGYDDPAGTKTNVEFSLATLAANSGIYAADGTIGAGRTASVTDTLTFGGATVKVGIGSVPSYTFEVRDAVAATPLARFRQENATGDGLIVRVDSTSSTVKALSVQNNAANQVLNVYGDGVVEIKGQGYTEFYDTANTTLTVNWNNSNIQELTGLTGSHTFTASNPKAGATYILTLAQTGTVTATWTGVKWPGGTAPTLSGTGKTDVVTLICYDATGAGLYYGSATLDLA